MCKILFKSTQNKTNFPGKKQSVLHDIAVSSHCEHQGSWNPRPHQSRKIGSEYALDHRR